MTDFPATTENARCLNITSLAEAQQSLELLTGDYHSALSKIAQAQIVIAQSIQTPSMSIGVVDTIIEYIQEAVDASTSSSEESRIRKIGALMIKNITFYQHALLEYERQNHSDKARDACLSAGRLLDNTLASVFELGSYVDGSLPRPGIVKAFASEIAKKGFLTKILSVLFSKQKLENLTAEHYRALGKLARKLGRRQAVFGESPLLAEFIEDNLQEIVLHDPVVAEKKKAWENTKGSFLQWLLLLCMWPFFGFYWIYRQTSFSMARDTALNDFRECSCLLANPAGVSVATFARARQRISRRLFTNIGIALFLFCLLMALAGISDT